MEFKVKDLTESFASFGLTGEEDAILIHDFDDRPDCDDDVQLHWYYEEFNISLEGKHLGCLYDTGDGYQYAEGREAGHLDY